MKMSPAVQRVIAYGSVSIVAVFLGKDFLFALIDAINAMVGAR